MSARWSDRIATIVISAIAFLLVVLLLGFVGYLLARGLAYVNLSFLTSEPESIMAGGGIGPELWDSFYLLVLSMIITVPIGAGAGIYLAEYASEGPITSAIRLSIEVLASLPSIVVALFGLALFVVEFHLGLSILSGALALSVLNLPVMARITEDAIRSVPREYKDGSLALGVDEWHTIRKVLVPAALPGLISGIILTAGRAFGEAAALLFTAGENSPMLNWHDWNPFSSRSPLNPMHTGENLAIHIWKVNNEGLLPDLNRVADGSAAVLLLMVLLFNLLARSYGSYLRRRMEGH